MMEMIFARDARDGDVLMLAEYCERLTVVRVHDEVVENSKVSVRRFETTKDGKPGPMVVRGWWEALRVVREAGLHA